MPADLAEPAELVAAIRARRGGALLHLDRMLLHSPPLSRAWNGYLGAVRTALTLDPRLRELAMCAVALELGDLPLERVPNLRGRSGTTLRANPPEPVTSGRTRRHLDEPSAEVHMAALLKTYFQDFKTDPHGAIFLTGPLSVGEYVEANLAITQHPTNVPNIVVRMQMGKISGTTLAPYVEVFPLDAPLKIHSHDVAGPELSVVLTGGPPNTVVSIQAWLFVR